MAENDREIVITLKAKNLAAAEFKAAAAQTAGLGKEIEKIAKGTHATGTSFKGLGASVKTFDSALSSAGFSLGPITSGLGELENASGKTAAELGKVATAGLVVAAGMAGWKIGRTIAEFFQLDAAIANTTARLLGWGDVAAQTAGAKADVLALASQRAGRQITDFTEALKVNDEWLATRKRAYSSFTQELDRTAQAIEHLTKQQRAEIRAAEQLGKSQGDIAKQLKLSETVIAEVIEKMREQERVREAAERKAETDRVKRLAAERAYWNEIGLRQRENEAARREFAAWRESSLKRELALVTEITARSLQALGGQTPPELMGRNSGQNFMNSFASMPNLAQTQQGRFQSAGPNWLTQQMQSLFGGADSFKGALQNMLGGIGTGIFQSIGSFITGGIGSLIGSISGLIGKGLGKLFGRDEESQKVNPMRDQFVEAAGGLDALNQAADRAGVTLDAMLRADTVEEYQAAIDELTDAINFQEQAMQTVRDAMDRYGLSVADMGAAWQQTELNDQAAQLITDFRALEAAGAGVETISVAMSDAINAYVQNALQAGATVPAGLQEIINQLITQGLLLDENGEAFEDMEDTGLTFAQTLDQQFGSLMESIQELIDAIRRGLGEAIDDVPPLTVPVQWDVPDSPVWNPGEDWTVAPLPGHARGGLFRDPHLAWIAEGGQPELIGGMEFMTQALGGAIDRLGSRLTGAGPSTLTVIVLDSQGRSTTLSREQLEAVQRAISGGQISIPVGSLTSRSA